MNKLYALFLVVLLLLIGFVVGALIKQYIILNEGNVQAVGVSIRWLGNNTEVSNVIYRNIENNTAYTLEPWDITNVNNTAFTLSLSTTSLSSNILSLSLTWNYTGTPLQPNEWQIIALTLTLSASDTNTFTFNTIIIATEVNK